MSYDHGTQAGTTQEHLAWDCARGTEDPTAYLGNHSEAGPEQTGEVILCCCPTCPTCLSLTETALV